MKNYLRIDRLIQSIVFIPYAICGILGAFGLITGLDSGSLILFYMMLHFVIGVIQIISGLIGGLAHRDKMREKYLLFNVIYFAILFLGNFFDLTASWITPIYVFIFPSIIATLYFGNTWKEYEETKHEFV